MDEVRLLVDGRGRILCARSAATITGRMRDLHRSARGAALARLAADARATCDIPHLARLIALAKLDGGDRADLRHAESRL